MNFSKTQEFTITSREEAELFVLRNGETLAKYGNGVVHISLADAFTTCQHLENGSKVFASIFDIYINTTLVWIDNWELGCTVNEVKPGDQVGASVLDRPDLFAIRMREHRYATSFVFRYRALWDKLMGLLILLAEPTKYERYVSAKSRKAEFKKISVVSLTLSSELAEQISDILSTFDNDFRTPEAHGMGRLRKYTFAMGEPIDRPPIMLNLKYWNILNEFLHQVGSNLANIPVGNGK